MKRRNGKKKEEKEDRLAKKEEEGFEIGRGMEMEWERKPRTAPVTT